MINNLDFKEGDLLRVKIPKSMIFHPFAGYIANEHEIYTALLLRKGSMSMHIDDRPVRIVDQKYYIVFINGQQKKIYDHMIVERINTKDD